MNDPRYLLVDEVHVWTADEFATFQRWERAHRERIAQLLTPEGVRMLDDAEAEITHRVLYGDDS